MQALLLACPPEPDSNKVIEYFSFILTPFDQVLMRHLSHNPLQVPQREFHALLEVLMIYLSFHFIFFLTFTRDCVE